MNEKTRDGMLTILIGLTLYFIPFFLLKEDPDTIVITSVVSMFSFFSLIVMATGWNMVKGKKMDWELIEELEKRVETLEER